MELKITPEQKKLQDWFYTLTKKPLYFVGGYVRDSLLGYVSHDSDVCAPVEALCLKRAADEHKDAEFRVIEHSYGLGTVVITSEQYGNYEYTAFRQDNYGRGGRHVPDSVSFTDDIEKDALRRDFTVNALYLSPDGSVLDPLNTGLDDLKNKIIRQCDSDTLSQDALRILRMVRFCSSLGFEIDKSTFEAAKLNVSGLADISNERIREEFVKILLADTYYGAADAVERGLYLLKELGAFKYIIEELLEGDGFNQNKKYHKYDVFDHNLHSAFCAPPKLALRYAALLHDIGKPRAFLADGNMYNHDKISADMARIALRRLTESKEIASNVCKLIENHMFDLDNSAKKNAVLRRAKNMGKEAFLQLAELREADIAGSGTPASTNTAQKWRQIIESSKADNTPIDKSELNVNGFDIMRELNLSSGREVGAILAELHDYALENPSQNNYQNLIEYAKIIYNRLGNH